MKTKLKPRHAAQQEIRKLQRAGLSAEMISVIRATNKQTFKLFKPMRAE